MTLSVSFDWGPLPLEIGGRWPVSGSSDSRALPSRTRSASSPERPGLLNFLSIIEDGNGKSRDKGFRTLTWNKTRMKRSETTHRSLKLYNCNSLQALHFTSLLEAGEIPKMEITSHNDTKDSQGQ